MSRPRVFVSSTYYDLRHIRDSLRSFIESLGYEAVLFEKGDVPFQHDSPLDNSCYEEVSKCNMFVLIVGGRFGSPASDSERPVGDELQRMYAEYNSVTQKEYETAVELGIPVFIFVEANVLGEYGTYKENRGNESIVYVYVDSVNVFKLLDEMILSRRNTYVKDFSRFEDISTWLREQWAGLFADFLSRKHDEKTLGDLGSQVSSLTEVSHALKRYSESMLRVVAPDDESERIITEQDGRLRAAMIDRFAENSLVSFILGHDDDGLDAARLFDAFVESHTFDDFIARSGVNDKFAEDLLTKHRRVAESDYDLLVERFPVRATNGAVPD